MRWIIFLCDTFIADINEYVSPQFQAHCALAPFWAEMLGRVSLVGKPKSHRGGLVRCHYVKDKNQVELAGLAVTAATGVFQRPMDFYYMTK